MSDLWWRERWKEAVYASDVGTPARLVAMIHADFARDKTWTWVEMNTLMRCTGLKKSQVLAARRQLADAGLLGVRKKAAPGRAPHFDMLIPSSNGSGNPEANGSGNPEALDGNGSGNPEQRVRESGMTGPEIRTLSITDQSIHQSLSPLTDDQKLARDLLAKDERDGDEDLLKNVARLVSGKDSPTGYLRTLHKNGDLRRRLKEASTKDDGWGQPTGATDDGWGQPTVAVDDYYRNHILHLGYDTADVADYLDRAKDIHPDGSDEKVWHEAWMTAQADKRLNDTYNER